MTENGKMQDQNAAKVKDSGDVALMIDGLYNWLSYDLKKMKEEILKELKASMQQTNSTCQAIQEDTATAAADTQKKVDSVLRELKYGYQQNQAIYEDVCQVISDTVANKPEETAATDDGVDVDTLAEIVKEKVVEAFPVYDELDTDKIVDSVTEKTAESNQKVLDAVAAIPLAENIDYTRIVEEVGDRVIEIINDAKLSADTVKAVDLDKLEEGEATNAATIAALVEAAVAKAMDNLDYDKLADAVAARMEDVHTTNEIVVDEEGIQKIADSVADKMDMVYLSEQVAERMDPIDYDAVAALVVEKLDETGSAPYEVVIDKEGVQQIAEYVSARLDSEVVAAKVAEKVALNSSQDNRDKILEVVMDEESVQAIAQAVADKLECACVKGAVQEEPVVEAAPVVEEEVEEVVEETVEEEPVVEATPVVEEVVEEAEEEAEEPVSEVADEVAPAAVHEIKEEGNELIDAETGLVIRLKRSFTAKMKQSEDGVKDAYSRIKNALKSYKKVNSNVSWHGDRFNFGRETIARINIVGKTLGLYLALDPANEEEFKPSVYHQKDVTGQKAYEGTPFMVKVRSEGAVKKAIRLISALAEKFGCEADEEFVEVNYVEEFAFQTTKSLLEEGLIKQTKEKKVALNF